MNMRTNSLLFMACMSLVACNITSNTPSPSLAEELSEKSPEEKQEILRLDCLNEAERMNGRTSMWQQMGHNRVPINDPKVEEMKSVCRDMTEAYFSSDVERHLSLAKSCRERILSSAHLSSPSIFVHAKKMVEICEAMTGQKVDLPKR